ncbi:MAG: DNA polymerase III subunit beta [Gammaproteobacteria bacterium]
MNTIVKRENILKPVLAVLGVVERKQTMPILSNVLIKINKNSISATGTDLEVELVAIEPHAGAAGELDTTVPGRKFADILRSFPEGQEVTLALDGDRLHLKAGRSRFTLVTQPVDDFPLVGEPETPSHAHVSERKLRELIRRTHFSMAQNDVRYYLNGLRIEFVGKHMRAVATDGHRLALGEIEIGSSEGIQEGMGVIVPRKGVLELERLITDQDREIRIAFGTNHLRIDLGELVITSKLVEGRFPDYQSVIPKDGRHRLLIERERLKLALSRAAILANEKVRGVRLCFESQGLRVVGHNTEQEEAEDLVEVSYGGESFEVGFNVSYLLDVLNAMDDREIELLINDPNSSCLIDTGESGNYRYVIMPMRL